MSFPFSINAIDIGTININTGRNTSDFGDVVLPSNTIVRVAFHIQRVDIMGPP